MCKYTILTFFSKFLSKSNQLVKESIYDANRKRLIQEVDSCNSWTEITKNRVQKILLTLSTVGLQANIKLELSYGSLLGYIRHNGIMPWDDDADLAIHSADVPNFLKAVEQEGSLLFDEFFYANTGIKYLKFWTKQGEPIGGHLHTFPFVDIWLYTIDNEKWINFSGEVRHPVPDYYPTKEVVFEGAKFGIPHNSLLCLDRHYKNWRKEIQVFPWSHRLERPSFKPLKVGIKVDANGKFVKYI
ncbi:hypothetical protein DTQ70_18845 [Runella sp. SP2]|nr:hypothetical protein DTQ70_18845 [Runella sp. SP2]